MKCVAFDLDGVLVNSKKAYSKAFLEVTSQLGFSCTREKVEALLGEPAEGVLGSLLPASFRGIEAAAKLVGEIVLRDEVIDEIEAAGSAYHTLEAIKSSGKYGIFLVTNSEREFTEKVLKRHSLFGFFDGVLTPESAKTKEERLKGILREKPSYYVGDLPKDVSVARNAGFSSVAVYSRMSWVYPDKERIVNAKPDFLISDLKELLPVLRLRLIRQSSI
jgi:HAD superfamily hydrolase (TIGR01549 family)